MPNWADAALVARCIQLGLIQSSIVSLAYVPYEEALERMRERRLRYDGECIASYQQSTVGRATVWHWWRGEVSGMAQTEAEARQRAEGRA